jgi:hypothetical protein
MADFEDLPENLSLDEHANESLNLVTKREIPDAKPKKRR